MRNKDFPYSFAPTTILMNSPGFDEIVIVLASPPMRLPVLRRDVGDAPRNVQIADVASVKSDHSR